METGLFFCIFSKIFSKRLNFTPLKFRISERVPHPKRERTLSPFLENWIYRSAGTLLYDEPHRGYATTPFIGRAIIPTENTKLPLVRRRHHTWDNDTSLRSWRRTRQRCEPMSSASNRTPVDFPTRKGMHIGVLRTNKCAYYIIGFIHYVPLQRHHIP